MKLISITSRSVTLELENSCAYFSPAPFVVSLNGKAVREENRNVFSVFSLTPATHYTIEAAGDTIEFTTLEEPFCFNVRDFYALGDGLHDDTSAFQAAISCLPENATLYVPAGVYFVKPLFLKSNMTMYLEKGAVMLGNPDRTQYPVLPALIKGEKGECNFGTWQGEEADCFASLLTAIGQSNIRIVGEGLIDGNAEAGDWYVNHRVKRIAWRPRGVFFNRCNNILLQGITVQNTPSWNIHPYSCKCVSLVDLILKNPTGMPTTDGIDPDACDGVNILGVKISVGDDCIAIKSGTLEWAKKYGIPCQNITVRNCYMCEGHGGVVLGSELSAGIKNIDVSRCLFEGTDRGLRIKTRRGRGRVGITDGITFSDIVMKGVKVPFVVNMYYNMGDETGHTEYVWSTEPQPVDDRTPYIGHFAFENMTCEGVEYSAGAFYGLPEAPIAGIVLKNVSFTYAADAQSGFPDMKEKNQKECKQGLYFQFVESVKLENVSIVGCEGKAITKIGVEKFTQK